MDRLNGTFRFLFFFFFGTENPDKTVLSDNGADLLTIGITVIDIRIGCYHSKYRPEFNFY